MQLGRRAATAAGSPLFIISAGLGLVDATQMVPAYGLTVGGRGEESLAPRVTGRVDSEAWWRAVSDGPFSTAFEVAFGGKSDLPVLLALTQPYAKLVGGALNSLGDPQLSRLRVFGISLVGLLPERVSRQVLPYDERLESVLPGTKVDFAQRALLHFVRGGLSANCMANFDEHRAWVEASLAGRPAPVRPARPRVSDEKIVGLIQRHLPEIRAIGRLLRVLRDREGVACEQARFSRLYRSVVDGGRRD